VSTLFDKVMNRASAISLYGIAPPKRTTEPERLAQIVQQQKARFRELTIDGLVVYDIQDESERSGRPRPFPFLPTVDPVLYADDQLGDFDVPKVVYRAVQALGHSEFTAWLDRVQARPQASFSVFVGAATTSASTSRLSLAEAYRLARQRAPKLVVGGIAIAERHARKLDEHARILAKTAQGCRFFVTQAVYDVSSMKSLLSDYAFELQDQQRQPVPIVCTFAPCGSAKTLDFMKWLGISFPRWLENELRRSRDPLQRSVTLCESIFAEVLDFAREKQLPLGMNVESVSIRKDEIDASVALLHSLNAMLRSSQESRTVLCSARG
jgi:hypothetical protein